MKSTWGVQVWKTIDGMQSTIRNSNFDGFVGQKDGLQQEGVRTERRVQELLGIPEKFAKEQWIL